MSNFVDSEASEEFESDQEQQNFDDSDEEEKIDAKDLDEEGNIAGLVNDDINDSSEDEEEEIVRTKKHKRKRKRSHQIDEDDIDLIEENLGVKLKKKKKYSRIQDLSDSDESGREEMDDADRIRNEIFNNEDEDSMNENEDVMEKRNDPVNFDVEGDDSEESDSDKDGFIVSDDEEDPNKQHHKKKKRRPKDAVLSQVQEIFGDEFNFDDFKDLGEGSGSEEDYPYEEYDDDEDMDEYSRSRRSKKSKKKTTTIYEIMEPDSLARGFYTEKDDMIRQKDEPERFQLRNIPVRNAEGINDDMIEESNFIYKNAFDNLTISKQMVSPEEASTRKPPTCVDKIQDILSFIRNEHFDIPYIAFYRKEYIEPHLDIHDIYKIYHCDEKWEQLVRRKAALKRLFKKVQHYQYKLISENPDKTTDELGIRTLQNEDIDKLHPIQTQEELNDMWQQFNLYYGDITPTVLKLHRIAQRKERGEEVDEEEEMRKKPKSASKRNRYHAFAKAGIGRMAEKFGLTPKEFAENVRDSYQRHEPSLCDEEPLVLAENFTCDQFPTARNVLEASKFMVSTQLASEPLVRQSVRQKFFENAMISVTPTKKGKKEIDESHACNLMMYLLNKPIQSLIGCQYLLLVNAEKDGLLNLSIHIEKNDSDVQSYIKEMQKLYTIDGFSSLADEWNTHNYEIIKNMLEDILYPAMIKEVKLKLMEEALEGVKMKCAYKLRGYLSKQGFKIEEREDENMEMMESNGVISMGVVYSDDRKTAGFAAVMHSEGELNTYLKLEDVRSRNRGQGNNIGSARNKDLAKLKDFIMEHKPHFIAIGVTDRFATYLQKDIQAVCAELEEEGLHSVTVELMDTELASVYAKTSRANIEFRDFPPELREAISLARRSQEPLVEFSQLCTPGETDLTCLKLHPMQDHVDPDELIAALHEEFIFRTCQVGVDVNKAIAHPHTANIVQFISGLGPRKATQLLKFLKQTEGKLENRSALVTNCKMGPKIFINCAGFIKIDTKSLESCSTGYIEVLDGLRVHPETYDWARKMAVDALEYDENADDNNPSSAINEILISPERLRDLDLDAFAVELERQGVGKRSITLYDIRNELNCRYKDFRDPYRPPTADEKFEMITKTHPMEYGQGKMITCQVVAVAYKRVNEDDASNDHTRDGRTGTWKCAVCQRIGFNSIHEIWEHTSNGECPGKPVGVRMRFENGLSGFIPIDKISDKRVDNPNDRVKPGQTLHCRILDVDVESLQCRLTCKSSDLRDDDGQLRQEGKDEHYNYEAEEQDKSKKEEKTAQDKNKPKYVKRVINHQCFRNVDFKTAEKLLKEQDDGDCIVRPSSSSENHLKVTWRISKEIFSHITIVEEKKENAFSLGKKLLIAKEEFEDIDEIIARYIQPMAEYTKDLQTHKYYRGEMNGARDKIDEALKDAKREQPTRIPYYITASTKLPGKFLLSYLPRMRPKHEYVTALPNGFRYRQKKFASINFLLRWFKEHHSDPSTQMRNTAMTPMQQTPNTPAVNGFRRSVNPMETPATPNYMPPTTPARTPQFRTPKTPSNPKQNYSRTPATPANHTPLVSDWKDAEDTEMVGPGDWEESDATPNSRSTPSQRKMYDYDHRITSRKF